MEKKTNNQLMDFVNERQTENHTNISNTIAEPQAEEPQSEKPSLIQLPQANPIYCQYYIGRGINTNKQIIVFDEELMCQIEKPLPSPLRPDNLVSESTSPELPKPDFNTSLWASLLFLSDTQIFIGGGRTELKGTQVIKTFQCYNPKNNTWDGLADLINPRSSFPMIYLNGFIYAIGGRNDYPDTKQCSIKKCEKYNLETNEWSKIADLNIPRSHSGAYVYKGEIFTFLGYRGFSRRTRKIEKYLEVENRWEIINMKMFASIDCFAAFPWKDHKMIIIGGNNNGHPGQGTFIVDIANGVTINCAVQNVGRKQNLYGYNRNSGTIYTFTDTAERIVDPDYLIQKKWGEDDVSMHPVNLRGKWEKLEIVEYRHWLPDYYKNFLTADRNFVIGDEAAVDVLKQIDFNDYLLFGTDIWPVIYAINDRLDIKPYPIPNSQHLRRFMGVLRIHDNQVFIAGGVNSAGLRVSKVATQFNMETFTAKRLPDMLKRRYNYAICLCQNRIYVMGGQNNGSDNKGTKVTLNDAEYFDLETKLWEVLPKMNHVRAESHCYVWRDEVYIVAGYKEGGRNQNIERFDRDHNVWVFYDQNMPVGIGAGFVIPIGPYFQICGGMNDAGDLCRGIYAIEMEKNRIVTYPSMKHLRIFGQFVKIGNDRIVFGGADNAEIISEDYKPRVSMESVKEFNNNLRELCSWNGFSKGMMCV